MLVVCRQEILLSIFKDSGGVGAGVSSDVSIISDSSDAPETR